MFGSGCYLEPSVFVLNLSFEPSVAIIEAAPICAFFLVGFLFFFIRHCNDSNAVRRAATGTGADFDEASYSTSPHKGLDQTVIDSFPIFVYSYVKNLQVGKHTLECAVCISEFEDDDTLCSIPKCSHLFHLDCIDAWLAYHVTCPVCRAKLTSDSDPGAKSELPSSIIAQLINSFNDTESIMTTPTPPPTTQRVEERNEIAIPLNEETRSSTEFKITGKFPRSHSTGHSLVQPAENLERFTLIWTHEITKQISESGKLTQTRSYDVVLGREGGTTGSSSSTRKGREGSSRSGKSYTERWVFSRTPLFVSKRDAVVKGGAGGGVGGSVKGKSNGVDSSFDV